MRGKKLLAGIGMFCLLSALLLPVQVHATENSGDTQITTTVPDTHIVLLDIGEHGCVIADKQTYTHKDKSIEVERLAELTYTIQPDKGWQVESVSYGFEDAQEAVELKDNAFTAPPVTKDGNKLTVRFKKAPFAGGDNTDKPATPDKGGNTHTGVKTGDNTNVLLWSMVAVISLAGVITVLLFKRRKSR